MNSGGDDDIATNSEACGADISVTPQEALVIGVYAAVDDAAFRELGQLRREDGVAVAARLFVEARAQVQARCGQVEQRLPLPHPASSTTEPGFNCSS